MHNSRVIVPFVSRGTEKGELKESERTKERVTRTQREEKWPRPFAGEWKAKAINNNLINISPGNASCRLYTSGIQHRQEMETEKINKKVIQNTSFCFIRATSIPLFVLSSYLQKKENEID